MDEPVRVDDLVVTMVIRSRVVSRCVLFPDQHWINVGDVIGLAMHAGDPRLSEGWVCPTCLPILPRGNEMRYST